MNQVNHLFLFILKNREPLQFLFTCFILSVTSKSFALNNTKTTDVNNQVKINLNYF